MSEPTLYTVEDGWIETYTGQRFHFENPPPEEIHLQDIAHSLAYQCRYNGHSQFFYSVAEHCVIMSDWLLDEGYSHKVALTALLHDAAETYIGDLARPVKEKVPQFKAIEAKIDRAVAVKFKIIYPFPSIIKECDTRILVDERRQVMGKTKNEWGTDSFEPLGVSIRGLSPEQGKIAFLEQYILLSSRVEASLG